MKDLFKKLQDLLLKLTIQPLYIQLILQFFAFFTVYRYVDNIFFDDSINAIGVIVEAVYTSIAITTASTFSHRKRHTSAGASSVAPQLEHWVAFQRAVIAAQPPTDVQARKVTPWLIEQSKNQRKRLLIYGPLLLLLGSLVNLFLVYVTEETYWLFFACILLVLGVGLHFEFKKKLSNIEEILDKLKAST
jgi:Gpi18-like mannosyltransferase